MERDMKGCGTSDVYTHMYIAKLGNINLGCEGIKQ
jgi:hypothetical protein